MLANWLFCDIVHPVCPPKKSAHALNWDVWISSWEEVRLVTLDPIFFRSEQVREAEK